MIFIIATGPSLTREDVDLCKDHTVYVVNDAYTIAPWANLLYACDGPWWDHHEGADFAGEKWTADEAAAERWGLNHIPATKEGLFHTEGKICYGKNSGFQAINLAYLHGHREVALLGFDMGFERKRHFFGEHPRHVHKSGNYQDFIDHFEKASPLMDRAGLKVVNCTRKTALTCFERKELCELVA